MNTSSNKKFVKTQTIVRRNAEIQEENTPEISYAKFKAAEVKHSLYSKVSDMIAESNHYLRNEPIPHGMDLFPMDWRMRYSDLYYPHARGGAVYIDTPVAPYEVAMCEIKHKTYAQKGIRYTYIKNNESHIEALARLELTVLPKGTIEASA